MCRSCRYLSALVSTPVPGITLLCAGERGGAEEVLRRQKIYQGMIFALPALLRQQRSSQTLTLVLAPLSPYSLSVFRVAVTYSAIFSQSSAIFSQNSAIFTRGVSKYQFSPVLLHLALHGVQRFTERLARPSLLLVLLRRLLFWFGRGRNWIMEFETSSASSKVHGEANLICGFVSKVKTLIDKFPKHYHSGSMVHIASSPSSLPPRLFVQSFETTEVSRA